MNVKGSMKRWHKVAAVVLLCAMGAGSAQALPIASVGTALESAAQVTPAQYREWGRDPGWRRDRDGWERRREMRRWQREREFDRWERHRRYREWQRRYGY